MNYLVKSRVTVGQVGVLDMLRYPVQPDAGRFWAKEYGNAAETEDHFKFSSNSHPIIMSKMMLNTPRH